MKVNNEDYENKSKKLNSLFLLMHCYILASLFLKPIFDKLIYFSKKQTKKKTGLNV